MKKIEDAESIILQMIKDNPKTSITQIADQMLVSDSCIRNYIKTLKEKGKLIRKGTKTGGFWEVVE